MKSAPDEYSGIMRQTVVRRTTNLMRFLRLGTDQLVRPLGELRF